MINYFKKYVKTPIAMASNIPIILRINNLSFNFHIIAPNTIPIKLR